MSKQLFVDPNEIRKPGQVTFEPIPCNQYQKKVKDELGNFTKEQFLNIYRDMLVLREFETMIQTIKTTSEYRGVSYTHPGPAHLGIGQEAAAVARPSTSTSTTSSSAPTGPLRHPRQGPVRHRKALR